MNEAERHNWSESDEKSLTTTVKWVDENISVAAMKDRGGKWRVVSGLLFTDIGLNVSESACRKRFSDIKNRLQKRTDNGKEVINLLGVDFPQVGEQTEEDKLKVKVSVLERKVENLINSLNTLSGLKENLDKIVQHLNTKSDVGYKHQSPLDIMRY